MSEGLCRKKALLVAAIGLTVDVPYSYCAVFVIRCRDYLLKINVQPANQSAVIKFTIASQSINAGGQN